MPLVQTRGAASAQGFQSRQPTSAGDPSVILLAHMNGPNGSTAFVDSSGKSTLVASGAAALSTTTPKFGNASLRLTGGSVICTQPQVIGASDFTIEMWINLDVRTGLKVFYDQRVAAAPAMPAPVIYWSGASFAYWTTGAQRIGGGVTNAGQWTAVCVCRSAGTTSLYVDGIRVGSFADTNVYAGGNINIGAAQVAGDPALLGYMDEIRVTMRALYTGASYTLQTAEFPNP